MAANRVGKTYCGAAETSYHLTGSYPKWWKGRRFNKPIRAWAAGESNDTTRDIIQKELFGNPQDPLKKGTGAVPLDNIVETVRKPGVPNAFSSVLVRHKSGGNSQISFKAYEQGFEKFMGEAIDVVWLDEEPKQEIFSQCITRTWDDVSSKQFYERSKAWAELDNSNLGRCGTPRRKNKRTTFISL